MQWSNSVEQFTQFFRFKVLDAFITKKYQDITFYLIVKLPQISINTSLE